MSVLKNLQPERVFYYFEEITKIPHGSGNTKQCKKNRKSAKALNVPVWVFYTLKLDPEVVQSKLKAVQARPGLCWRDGPGIRRKDKVSAEYSLLNCLGLTANCAGFFHTAYALALLEDDSLCHPALEVLITVDEEIGLLGAVALDTTPLKGRYLINLDSEEEGYLWVGCAGGLRTKSRIPVKYQEAEGTKYEITVTGLLGGHSGSEIDKNRANATLLLGRFLFEAREKGQYVLAELEGGQKDNAIPRTARALILTDKDTGAELQKFAGTFTGNLRKEYAGSDEGITVTVEARGEGKEPALHPVSLEKVLFFLLHYPNGIQKMCGYMEGLVETSCNLGITKLTPEDFQGFASVRSSVATEKKALADKIAYLTEFLGGEYKADGDYPSWEYKQDSRLRPYMVDIYEKLFHTKPEVRVIHAGLECGLFYEKIPGLDCVYLGPDMKDIHTTEEQLSISSVQKVWEYLIEVLKNMKE